MADTNLIPKQRTLGSNETLNSLESWKESLLFHLIINPKLVRFTDEDDLGSWGHHSQANRSYTPIEAGIGLKKTHFQANKH